MSVQTSYGLTLTEAIEGAPATNEPIQAEAFFNEEASAAMMFGKAVMQGTAENGALLPVDENSDLAGVLMHANQYTRGHDGAELTDDGLIPGSLLNIARKGKLWVRVATGCTKGERAWYRAIAGVGEEQGWENADDGSDTIDCQGQAIFRTSCAADGLAVLEFDFTNLP